MLLTIVIVITADTRKPETRKPSLGLLYSLFLHQLKFDHPVGRGFLPLSRFWRRRQEEIALMVKLNLLSLSKQNLQVELAN